MNHLTDEQWDRLFEVLQGIRDGKTIQWHHKPMNADAHEWLDDKPVITDLVRFPLRYRVKPEPETVTIYIHRMPIGQIYVSHVDLSEYEYELLYSFEHEVQQ